jgi:hypothetical protein
LAELPPFLGHRYSLFRKKAGEKMPNRQKTKKPINYNKGASKPLKKATVKRRLCSHCAVFFNPVWVCFAWRAFGAV